MRRPARRLGVLPFLPFLPFLAMATPAGAAQRPAPPAAPFTVVVNAGNPLAALPASEVSKMFLKKATRWPSGQPVAAVDLPDDSPVREGFSQAIHQRATTAVRAYWQKMIFSGRDVPPPEEASATAVLAHVRANPGGIGYVPAGTPLPDGVKALKVLP
jgi:ABC-type phosphate transport system substrate-binding protein